MIRVVWRHLVAAAVGVAVLVGAVGVAIAQTGGSDSSGPARDGAVEGNSAASPESGERGVGVPRGPFIDFCPSAEQTEAHLKQYGFEYKPVGVACNREGEVAPPATPIPDDPDDSLSDKEACERDKQELLSAEPLDDHDGDPTTLRGRLPNGAEVIVGITASKDYAEKLRGMNIREYANTEFEC